MRGAGLLALALVLWGCSAPPPPQEPRQLSEAELRRQITANSLDPWPHYALAHLYEEQARWEEAIDSYGHAINLVPPRTATRPLLDLGVLHHRLGNAEAALRCYQEILDTHPGDTQRFRQNIDYPTAALGAKPLLAARDETARLEALHQRFLDEMGGTEAEWEAGPVWVTPIEAQEPPRRPAPAPN